MEEPELFEEMVDSTTMAGKVQDESRTSCLGARKQGNAQRMMGINQKDAEANLKGLPLAINNDINRLYCIE